MAEIANPRKKFQFGIFIPGMNQFLAQEVKLPDSEIDMVEHGDVNFDVKTGGKRKIGMLSVTKIMPADSTDNFMWSWQDQIQDIRGGGGDLPSDYKKRILVEQYGPDGLTTLQRWELIGAWPQKINGVDFSRKDSENTVETIDFCVDQLVSN